MRTLAVLMLVAALAAAAGCGRKGPEGVAGRIFEAAKAGDTETALKYMDLRGIYDQVVARKKADDPEADIPVFGDWEKQFNDEAKKDAKPDKLFEYEILDGTEKGATAAVKVKTRAKSTADWEERTLEFIKVDEAWKLSAASFDAVGFFEPEPTLPDPEEVTTPDFPDSPGTGPDVPSTEADDTISGLDDSGE